MYRTGHQSKCQYMRIMHLLGKVHDILILSVHMVTLKTAEIYFPQEKRPIILYKVVIHFCFISLQELADLKMSHMKLKKVYQDKVSEIKQNDKKRIKFTFLNYIHAVSYQRACLARDCLASHILRAQRRCCSRKKISYTIKHVLTITKMRSGNFAQELMN